MQRRLRFSTNLLCAAVLVFGCSCFNNSSCADTEIRAFDLEGENDPDFMFTFSESSLVPITMDDDSPNGNGSEGIEFAITSTTAGAGFAGAGIGLFELNVDPRFVAGEITVELLDLIVVTFDAETEGIPINSVRFEASLPAGDFDNRVEFPAPEGAWQTYTIAFADLDATAKANMVASMNSNAVTGMNLAFSFTQNDSGEFVAGDIVRFDNVSMVACEPMTTVDVLPTAFEATAGILNAGGLPELSDSDNSDVSIRRSSTDIQSRCYLEITATSPTLTPSQMDFTLEASVFARTAVTQRIELYDFVAEAFVEIDSQPAARFSDTTTTAAGMGDLSRFVDPANSQIRARCRYNSANPRQSFAANIDHTFWTITQ